MICHGQLTDCYVQNPVRDIIKQRLAKRHFQSPTMTSHDDRQTSIFKVRWRHLANYRLMVNLRLSVRNFRMFFFIGSHLQDLTTTTISTCVSHLWIQLILWHPFLGKFEEVVIKRQLPLRPDSHHHLHWHKSPQGSHIDIGHHPFSLCLSPHHPLTAAT